MGFSSLDDMLKNIYLSVGLGFISLDSFSRRVQLVPEWSEILFSAFLIMRTILVARHAQCVLLGGEEEGEKKGQEKRKKKKSVIVNWQSEIMSPATIAKKSVNIYYYLTSDDCAFAACNHGN